MKFHGDVQLQQNFLKEAVIPLDSYFPVTPKVGQIVFKDRVLYICVEISAGTPIWVPLTNEITAFTHIQTTNSASWTINHPLNTAHVSVTVYDTDNRVVLPDEIKINSSSQITVGFSQSVQGKVVILTGTFDGQTKPTYAYEHIQTNLSTSWTIPHALGRYPIVRIFIGNQEVQPLSITFDTLDQVTITFSSAQVGQAKLI